jgi:glycerophosphoryl diester phosphodiesterase
MVLSHRGWWTASTERNTAHAFRRSLEAGFGLETDVRDAHGRLVISHDLPVGGELALDDFFAFPGAADFPLAINVKADGLAELLRDTAARHQVRDWFVFDMSVPDARSHLLVGNPVFTRMSEVERSPAWLDEAQGVWLDAFSHDWYDLPVVEDLLAQGKRVCVASPELHGRSFEATWALLSPLRDRAGLMLCTDLPQQARQYFAAST